MQLSGYIISICMNIIHGGFFHGKADYMYISVNMFCGTNCIFTALRMLVWYGAIHLWRPHRVGEGVRLRWTHVDGGGSSPMWTFTQKIKIRVHWHRKLKLESTDVILPSSHAKKLAFFIRISSFDRKKVEIFLRYKLVIQITNSTV